MDTYINYMIFDTLVTGTIKCLSSVTSAGNCLFFLKRICLLLFTSHYMYLSNPSRSQDKGE